MSFSSCSFGTPRDVCTAGGKQKMSPRAALHPERSSSLAALWGRDVPSHHGHRAGSSQLLALLQLLQQADKSQHPPKSQLLVPLSSTQGIAYEVPHVPEMQRD